MTQFISACVFSALLVSSLAIQAQDLKPQDKAPAAPAVSVPFVGNATCPAMGKATKPDVFVATEKGAIYLCCKGCTEKVTKDPAAAYAKAYPKTEKLGNKLCPVTAETIKAGEGKAVTYKGYEIMACCPGCEKAVIANGDIIVTLLTNPKIVDVRNANDPVTGKPAVDNTFVLIGDDLVHLSSKDSVEEIKKDSAKFLKTAKSGATKGPKECTDGEKKGG